MCDSGTVQVRACLDRSRDGIFTRFPAQNVHESALSMQMIGLFK